VHGRYIPPGVRSLHDRIEGGELTDLVSLGRALHQPVDCNT
jgi:hypothetical protein